jgi:hypothetical protein
VNANAFVLPSDSQILVDACVARVREAARLDDEPVLPPPPSSAAREIVVLSSADLVDLPSARSIAEAAGRANAKEGGGVAVRPGSAARVRRWPVVLCGLVAFAAAFASWATSPPGKPTFDRAAQATRGEVARAAYVLAGVIDPS